MSTRHDYSRAAAHALEPQNGNLFVDPRLVAFDRGLVKFAPDSPAVGLGIEEIDVSGAGPRRNK